MKVTSKNRARLLVLSLILAWTCPTLAQQGAEQAGPGAGEQEPPEELTIEAYPAPVPPIPDRFRVGGSDYRIGRQDLLEIRVFGLEDLNQTVRVSDDGSITLPLLGRLPVADLTKTELEELITVLLEAGFVRDPQVTLFVKEYESKKVAVSGSVKKPDTYEMLGQKTLLEMISLAGGLDQDFGEEIVIFRPDGQGSTQRLAVDLDRLVYQADPQLNQIVLPGDIIYVPAIEKIRIFVSGEVANPDLYEIPRSEPITVLRAVTLAGGTTDRASQKRVQIIRIGPDGERVVIPVDLRKVKRGKLDDPMLQEDDLVLVPSSFF